MTVLNLQMTIYLSRFSKNSKCYQQLSLLSSYWVTINLKTLYSYPYFKFWKKTRIYWVKKFIQDYNAKKKW